ncbi:hypothetical protein ABC345_00985 [Shouchella sp. 1P09AA]|uniref:YobI family P-loop NTPase n=1 Tax=unclassified Shouchella TaxID=2893065 RepID=UPI0039A09781
MIDYILFKLEKLKIFLQKLKGNNESGEKYEFNDKYNFQKLTPDNDVNLEVYNDAINYIFSQKDIRNIAISGPYGAGKSSVISTYIKKNSKLEFLNISLAHFKPIESEEQDKPELNSDQNKRLYINHDATLEGKILNQLIHQIPSKKIPQTLFKVKRKIRNKTLILSTIVILLFMLSVLSIFTFDLWNEYVATLPESGIKNIIELSTNDYIPILSGLLAVATISLGFYSIVKLQMNRNVFRKLNLQGNEIEIFGESNDSFFDKYLNEVLYLFDNVEADVIVFEDIDRFEENRIFERLREINTLVNIKKKNNDQQPLRFFYLIRDDLFVSKDRTKFFDYIVPIVPIVDSSNALDQFIKYFKKGGIYNLFNESFLNGLSLYIDDMRILKNIYNEFVVYYRKLNITELNCDKMLAIIVYKNLFPRDYTQLQLNKGMVYTLFAKKENFIEGEIKRIDTLINEKTKEIEVSEREHLNNIKELDIVLEYNQKQNWHYRQEKQKEINERKIAIENKVNHNRPYLEEEKAKLEEEKVVIQFRKLSEIITRENIDTIFSTVFINEIGDETDFHEVKSSDYFSLLKYLLRNGYIDESYPDYLTYFHEISLSREDKMFLRSVTDKKAKDFSYQLKNPNKVVNKLQLVDFDQKEVLNFDIMQYLLNSLNESEYLDRLIQQVKDKKNYRFIGEYFDTDRERALFVKTINRQWTDMLSYAIDNNVLHTKQLRSFIIYTLYNSNKAILEKINKDNKITSFISNNNDFLDMEDIFTDKVIDCFMILDVSFVSIGAANSNLLKQVYEKSLYELNFGNLSYMLSEFYKPRAESEIVHSNYTLVIQQNDSPLSSYIHKNINSYVRNVLSNCNGEISDLEEAAIQLLNNEELNNDYKEKYIHYLTRTIVNISDVKNQKLWGLILSNGLAEYTAENVMNFYVYSKSLSSILMSFINNSNVNLDFNEVVNDWPSEIIEEFYFAAIAANDLDNKKYKEILVSLKLEIVEFQISAISDEKIIILIHEDIIPMNLENLKFMRKEYPNQVFQYIKKHIVAYVDLMTDEDFILEEMIEILSWDVEEDLKINLLNYTNGQISIINKCYSDNIKAQLIKNHLEPNDLPHLYSKYEEFNNEVQQIVFKLAMRDVDTISYEPEKISKKLIDSLIRSEKIDFDDRLNLLISILPKLNEEHRKSYLISLDLAEFNKVFEKRTRPRFKIDYTSKKLLSMFRDINWISHFEEDQNKQGFYKITKMK